MERFFLTDHKMDGDFYLGGIRNIDYYARDFIDTKGTIARIRDSMEFAPKHPVRQAIHVESGQTMTMIQVGKFAHAEQKALDRLASLLPDIMKAVSGTPHNASTIHAARIHMLVNNDSCSRCDAVIKASIESNGWLVRTLRASIETAKQYSVTNNLLLELSCTARVSAAVSSFAPYGTGEPLDGFRDLTFYSRGGICKHVKSTDRWTKDSNTTSGAIFKFYE